MCLLLSATNRLVILTGKGCAGAPDGVGEGCGGHDAGGAT